MIRKDIYDVLMTSSFTVTTQAECDSLGDRLLSKTATYYGYVYRNTEKIYDSAGVEVLSHVQIYMRGSEAVLIGPYDTITCADANVQDETILSCELYRGRYSIPVIGVLYLP